MCLFQFQCELAITDLVQLAHSNRSMHCIKWNAFPYNSQTLHKKGFNHRNK